MWGSTEYLVFQDSNVLNENEEMTTHAYEGLVEWRQSTMKQRLPLQITPGLIPGLCDRKQATNRWNIFSYFKRD
jgi:hypothetical protein